MKRLDAQDIQRKFESNIEMITESGCWIWSGTTGRYDAPLIFVGLGKMLSAHRYAYETFKHKFGRKSRIFHKCGVGLCVNPNHLSIGKKENDSHVSLSQAKKRFYSKVAAPDENGCMDWLACTTGAGYGMFKGPNDMGDIAAHRFSYMLNKGPIPHGINCLHKCDRYICVAPDHLFLGTQADNMRDMKEKNRQAMGEKNGQAKLSNNDVIEIRAKLAEGLQAKSLSIEYGVGIKAISKIKLRQRWTHVT